MLRSIEESDREEIVRQFSETLESGAEKSILDSVRRRLEEQFCPKYTARQVNAVCSQVIIQKNRFRQSVITTIQPTTPEVKPQDRNTVKIHPKSGAWADYEHSEVKEKWRKVELDFFDRQLDTWNKKPEEMSLLCTPGIKCYLELRPFLARGIKPQNICAVEREKAAWGEFASNCHELGIQPRFGDLKDILPEFREKFDVVLLDFVGPLSYSGINLVYKLPVADRAMIAINTLGKRENAETQESLAYLHKASDGTKERQWTERIQEKIKNGAMHPSELIHQTSREVQDWANDLEGEISNDIRDTALWYCLKRIGLERPDNWMMPNLVMNIPNISVEEVKAARNEPNLDITENYWRTKSLDGALEVLERMFIEMQGILLLGGLRTNVFLSCVHQVCHAAAFGEKQIAHLEKYSYKSKIGKTPSPFHTNLAMIELPTAEYKKLKSTIQFALTCARSLLQESCENYETAHEKSSCFLEAEGVSFGQISSNAKIAFYKERKRITSIPLTTLLHDLASFENLVGGTYPLSFFENMKNQERRVIE